MEVKFIKCASSKLSSVPVVDGQVICLTDGHGILYDMNGARKYASKAYSISDAYKTSAGAASSGVAASSKAIADAYAEINSKLNWKYWNNAFGTTSIALPKKFDELIIEVERGESNVRYSIHVTYAQLTWTINNPGTELCFKADQCTTSTNYESVSVIATTTYARIYAVYDSGQDITDSSELRVYYR